MSVQQATVVAIARHLRVAREDLLPSFVVDLRKRHDAVLREVGDVGVAAAADAEEREPKFTLGSRAGTVRGGSG
ncbi:hypothetical protein ASA1KI_27700 [Opitutales bacterium ASA1]|nr:hypothetical protein ASA1KI_27700 [Opitutales bacterium ASA1]